MKRAAAISLASRRRSARRSSARKGDSSLEARIEATAAAGDRIVRALQNGYRDFVLSSLDGAVSARIKLVVADLAASEYQLASARLFIDWSRCAVMQGERRVVLSRTELRLLAALLDGEGMPLSREELITRVWPGDRVPPSSRENALAVYVCSLRKRLAAIGAERVLETVRGRGYRVAVAEAVSATR